MENIIDFPDREIIETEACAWVSKLDAHEKLPDTDAAALQAWVNRSPLHYQELRRVADLWGDLNRLTELLPALNQLPTQPQPSGFMASITGGITASLSNIFNNSRATRFASAALVMVALMVMINLYPGDPNHRAYHTAIGEQRSIDLPDGSVMQLNTASQVKIDFNDSTRTVRLIEGEAHFDVAHNKARPFEVSAGSGLVRAIGTAFTVYLNNQQVEVTVTEGQVEVAPKQAQPIEGTADISNPKVSANQHITYNGNADPVRNLEQAEITKKLSWRQGMLLFSGESLEQVVSQVSRYTTNTIIITDPTISDIRIAGYFKADDTRALFDALSISFGVQVIRVDKNLVHLSRLAAQ
ncbi:FecR family protein [Porticoccaceae bacterium]|nr:FecR family protein [Porticoccaceae bacterium]